MHLELESVTYGLGHSFASIVFEGPKFLCPYHRHPEIELVAIDAGSGRLAAGDYTGTFRGGDLFFLGENLPHIFQNSTLEPRSPRYARSHVIQFRRDFAGDGLFNIPEFQSVKRLYHLAGRGLKITGVGQKRIRGEMRAIHESRSSRRVLQLLELLCDLASIRSLMPLASGAYDAGSSPADGRMPDIMAYIHENLTGSLSVPEASRRAGFTPNAFSRYFKQQTRRTFTDVVNEMRVGEACRLLLETEASVIDICHASGFGNLAHFHSEFRKRMRISPLKFRMRY